MTLGSGGFGYGGLEVLALMYIYPLEISDSYRFSSLQREGSGTRPPKMLFLASIRHGGQEIWARFPQDMEIFSSQAGRFILSRGTGATVLFLPAHQVSRRKR